MGRHGKGRRSDMRRRPPISPGLSSSLPSSPFGSRGGRVGGRGVGIDGWGGGMVGSFGGLDWWVRLVG